MEELGLECNVDNLDDFIKDFDSKAKDSDVLQHYADQGFIYKPKVQVDIRLDPYSDAYREQQIALYEEISGRKLYELENEIHELDIEPYVNSPSPFFKESMGAMPLHLQRLSKLYRFAELTPGSKLIDFGPGSGVSAEISAYLGNSVSAVDINPYYVELINRRAKNRGLPIEATCIAFEEFESESNYDGALFYESLHHALKPWETLAHVSKLLKPTGKLLLAGEPVNDIWWPHWGLRMDSISIWAIRKFGWFESGWSMEFLKKMLTDVGLKPVVIQDNDPEIGPIVIGLAPNAKISFNSEMQELSNTQPISEAVKLSFFAKVRRKLKRII